jgi:hypothetical protein
MVIIPLAIYNICFYLHRIQVYETVTLNCAVEKDRKAVKMLELNVRVSVTATRQTTGIFSARCCSFTLIGLVYVNEFSGMRDQAYSMHDCLLFGCLPSLKMEPIPCSETSAHMCTTRRHNPKDGNIHNYRCEELKSYNYENRPPISKRYSYICL